MSDKMLKSGVFFRTSLSNKGALKSKYSRDEEIGYLPQTRIFYSLFQT